MDFLATLDKWGKENIPSNMRLFGSTLFGDRSAIDESYFSNEDLQAMRRAAESGLNRRATQEATYLRDIEEYGRMPSNKVISQKFAFPEDVDAPMYGVPGTQVTAKQKADEIRRTLESLGKRPKTIQYEDYPKDTVDVVDEANWLKTIQESFNNPDFRAATSIGRAVVTRDQSGNLVIEDTYDWNNNNKYQNASIGEVAGLIAKNIGQPQKLGNIIGNALLPQSDKARKVKINLGK